MHCMRQAPNPCVDLESSVALYLQRLRPEAAEGVMYKNAARFLGLEQP